MKRISLTRERGVALLALLAVIMLVASWFLVSKLNAESGGMSAVNRARNAEVLNRAKQALIGYVAMQALNSGEDNPGALPCPEAAGYFDNPGQEGQTASSCTLPKVGRFPWRTIGTEKLLDSAGEPLWYVVSAGWAYTSGNTNINSNTLGQLTVDGVASAAVALIIAPGPAFNVPACGSNAAKVQKRPTSDPLDGNPFPDLRNYLECENATAPTPDATFVTSGTSGSFNDQVVVVTVADIMPGIEAAIAKRIERDIVPVLKTVYTPTTWGISGSNPVHPFAAPFASPGPGAGTSSFEGAAGTYQGLLPFNQTQGCTLDAAIPRCLPSLIAWQATPANAVEVYGYGYIMTGGGLDQVCSWQSSGEVRECTGHYHEHDTTISSPAQPSQPIRIEMTATFTNVAMGLRAIDSTKMTVEARNDETPTPPWQSQTVSYTVTMNDGSVVGKPAGSVTITFGATLPNIDVMSWGTYAQFRISIDRSVVTDHALLSSTNSTTGWFVRNEWYRLVYYAVAQGHTAATLPPVCTTGTSCLTVTNLTPSDNKRALLILAGRSTVGATRPNGTLSDFVEFDNANLDTVFEKQPVSKGADAAAKKPFNDRIIVLDSN